MTTFYRIPKLALAAVSLGMCSLLATGCNLFPVTPLLDRILAHRNSAVIFTKKYVFIPKPLPLEARTQSNPYVTVNMKDLVEYCDKHEESCCYANFRDGKLIKPGWMGNRDCLNTHQKNRIEKAAEDSGGTAYAGYFGKATPEGKGGDTCMKTMITDVTNSPALQSQIAMLLEQYRQ